MCSVRLREPYDSKKAVNGIIPSKCDSSEITLMRLVDGSGYLWGRKHLVYDHIDLGFAAGT